MKRRSFLQHSGMAGILAAGTAPAFAQGSPAGQVALRLELPEEPRHDLSARPRSPRRRVSDVTGGKFQIQVFASGEIVPGLQVADAVQNGTVECGHTAPYYYVGKDPTFAFGTAIPFGLNQRQYDAWWFYGGGEQLYNEFLKSYSITSMLVRQHRRADGRLVPQGDQDRSPTCKGLKMRIGGFAGQVLAKLGVVPQQIAGGEIYPALEKGTIDAAEWVGPVRRREARLQQGREVLLLPRLVGRRTRAAHLRQHGEVQRAAGGIQGGAARRLPRGQHA